jgi:hypothetical protein
MQMTESYIPPDTADSDRFRAALQKFDEENARDPNSEMEGGTAHPRELLYARRLTSWVHRLNSSPCEALCLAARCQHLCRWQIPRNSYPGNRAGYLRWRNDLKKMHSGLAGRILHDLGYPDEIVHRVQDLNLKKLFPADPDSRILEDALCLVFLEFQFADLAAKTDREKVLNALRKSWKKMTERARAEALKLPYGKQETDLLHAALNEPEAGLNSVGETATGEGQLPQQSH